MKRLMSTPQFLMILKIQKKNQVLKLNFQNSIKLLQNLQLTDLCLGKLYKNTRENDLITYFQTIKTKQLAKF